MQNFSPASHPPPLFPQAKDITEPGQPFPHLDNPKPSPLPPLPVYFCLFLAVFSPVSSVCCRGKWHEGCLASNSTRHCGQGETVHRVCVLRNTAYICGRVAKPCHAVVLLVVPEKIYINTSGDCRSFYK